MRRWLFITLGVIGALAAAAVGGLVLFTQTDWGRERVRRFAVDAMQGTAHWIVRVGRVRGNLLKGITIDGFSITDSAGNPFLAAESVTARYALRNFVSKRIYLDDVRLVRPVIVLDRPPGGQWNYERIFAGDSTPTDTTQGPGFGFRYLSPVGPIRVDLGINPSVADSLRVITESDNGARRGLVQLQGTESPTGEVLTPGQRQFAAYKRGGAVGNALGRLVLHLSIGEAF